jgi:hypothetical protein
MPTNWKESFYEATPLSEALDSAVYQVSDKREPITLKITIHKDQNERPAVIIKGPRGDKDLTSYVPNTPGYTDLTGNRRGPSSWGEYAEHLILFAEKLVVASERGFNRDLSYE